MDKSAIPVRDARLEAEAIDAIVALDWSHDPVKRPVQIIEDRFGVDERTAFGLFENFKARNLIVCRPEPPALNRAEFPNAPKVAVKSRWLRPDESMR